MKLARGLLLAVVLMYVAAFVIEHVGVFAQARDRDLRDLDRSVEHIGTPAATRGAALALSHARQSAAVAPAAPRLGRTLFAARFGPGNHLVTNDYAYYNHQNSRAVRSSDWLVTSGSLFAHNRAGWTGVPDSTITDALSRNGTGSATFRLVTRRRDFGNVAVSFDLKMERLVTTRRNPAHSWDGVHVFLHYRSQHSLYVVSIDRRDGVALVKKKRPGGPANGGTYYTIGASVHRKPLFGRWERVLVTISSTAPGSVEIACYVNGRPLLSVQDPGVGGQPLAEPGAVGIRGDNAEFAFARFRIRVVR